MYFLGSKKKYSLLINKIIENRFLDVDIYAEPFAGGLNILPYLEHEFREYYINDINKDLYDLYIDIRDNNYFDERLLELQKNHSREKYYEFREEYNRTREPALLFYLLHTCYRSFYRIGSKGNFNCPCYREYFVWDSEELSVIRSRLQKAYITNVDWSNSVEKIDARALFVLDPPYENVLNYYGDMFENTKRLMDFSIIHNSILFNFDEILRLYKDEIDVNKFNDIIYFDGKMRFGADKPLAKNSKKREIVCIRSTTETNEKK